MPVISAGDLALLRGGDHRTEFYLSVWQPATLWSAQVNNASIARSAQTIAFDGGSGSAFAQVEAHQTVWVGSAPGAHDIGKARIKSVSSSDSGVTGTLVVGSNGIVWEDDHYLTFLHDYEVWPAFNRVDSNEVFYKDWDSDGGIAYTNQNTNIPPVCIAGPHRAGFLSGGSVVFSIPIGDSYALANGATITGRSVGIYPTTGVTVGPYIGGAVSLTFTQAGQFVAKCTATDSNGTSQVTYRKFIIHDPSPGSADYPIVDISAISLTGDWDNGGWTATVRVNRNASVSVIPDGNLAILWRKTWYGSTQKDISLLDEGGSTLICGYIRRDSIDMNQSSAVESSGTVSFSITTVEALLTAKGMFSVPLEINASPSTWWQYQNGILTAGRILHYLYRWHSTLFHTHDFLGLDDDGGIDRKAIDFEKGTLYEMGDEFVRNRGIMAHIVCDKAGNVRMSRDLAFRIDADRASAITIADITEQDISGSVTFIHAPEPSVSFVFYSGVTYDGSEALPVGSTAPAETPSQFGGRDVQVQYQMISDQAYSNQIAGQVLAVHNNEWPEVRVTIPGDYLGVLEPAIQEWWEMDVASGDTPKGFIWTDKKMLCRSVTVSISLASGTIQSTVIFEPEVDGTDGVPYLWPDALPVPGGVVPTVPAFGGGFAILTGSSIYYLGGGTSTWVLRTGDAVNNVIQDPFWRTASKQNTSAPSSAIILTAEDGQARRSVNAGVSLSMLSPGNPPNDAGDSPAPTLSDVSLTQLEGSFIDDGTFIWLARYENSSGEWRSWLLHSDDNGSTFTWQSVS